MTDTAPTVQAIVIGAGHNGLVCAAYLARAGRKVLVLEAAEAVGGAAITREFAPGFRAPAVAHLLHLLDPGIASELALAQHGLSFAHTGLKTVSLADSGSALVLDGDKCVAGELSSKDRAALVDFERRMQRFAAVLAGQHGRAAPHLAWSNWREALPAASLALAVRRLGRADMREFLRIAAVNIHDVLEENFDSPLLKGALALDAVLGTHAGPRSGNTVFAFLHRRSGAIGGRSGALALPKGGMGSVTAALANYATSLGVEIRTRSAVAEILVNQGRVSGVRLESGEEMASELVVSNADPKTTLLGLLGARHLEAGFARRIQNLRMNGTAAKLHLALSAVPVFRGVAAGHLGERIVIAPDPDYVERAFNPAKYHEFSAHPVLELTIPTVRDPGLAPAGSHVLSAIVQYAPYELAGGWETGRQRFLETVLDLLERHAPGIRGLILGSELLTPADIETQFRIRGGHWHHGELALDQLLMLRPVPGAAHHAMPVPGLWLCGAGCHPGGGVMGQAGRNAARAILDAGANS
jgi:phytoene dehydrogenase-like protein